MVASSHLNVAAEIVQSCDRKKGSQTNAPELELTDTNERRVDDVVGRN